MAVMLDVVSSLCASQADCMWSTLPRLGTDTSMWAISLPVLQAEGEGLKLVLSW